MIASPPITVVGMEVGALPPERRPFRDQFESGCELCQISTKLCLAPSFERLSRNLIEIALGTRRNDMGVHLRSSARLIVSAKEKFSTNSPRLA